MADIKEVIDMMVADGRPESEIVALIDRYNKDQAEALGCITGAALFVMDRITWNGDFAVTKVRIFFAQGHRMQTVL